MTPSDRDSSVIATWDPVLTERLRGIIRPVIEGRHRAQVRGRG
ncbi:hypothetical protein [Mycolicibacterium madagascariense]|nr:hypothetical protein [Mycolicibacterium madagascariense]